MKPVSKRAMTAIRQIVDDHVDENGVAYFENIEEIQSKSEYGIQTTAFVLANLRDMDLIETKTSYRVQVL